AQTVKSVPFALVNGLRNIHAASSVGFAVVIQTGLSDRSTYADSTDAMSLNRRTFVKRSALAIAGASLSRFNFITVAAAPKKIIIIGAGMAGLSAGYELTQLGHDVTILEARSRPGGRVHTLREPFSDGLYAEAGAARIPENHNLTLKYVKLFDVQLEPMYPAKLSALRV